MDARRLRQARGGIRAHEAERDVVAAASLEPRRRRVSAAAGDVDTAVTPPPPAAGRKQSAGVRLVRARAGLRAHESQRVAVEVAPEAAPAGDGPPARIGAYLVEAELGRGGAGVVYAARDPALGRRVAIKVLRPERARPELIERFHIEGRAAARLRHPHIVGVHEVGEDAGRPYLVMELVEGRSLAARLRDEGPLPALEVGRIGLALAQALAYAHERLVLHRDLKPGNVLLGPKGEALLSDFGLAREVDREDEARPTVTGQVMGTPAYMSPEQAQGAQERVDQRSDVWSLGATLYELLCGAPPFRGDSALQVLQQVTSLEPVAPVRALRPQVDRDLATVVERCLEKDPADRYPTAEGVARDLQRWLSDEPIQARPPSLAERLRKWLRRNRALARGVGGVLLLALVGGAAGASLFVLRLSEEKRNADAARAEAERDRARADEAAREASRQAERARVRAAVAQEALRTLVVEVREELQDVPGRRVREVRARLLGRALEQLQRLRDDDLRQELVDLEAAEAERQMGQLARVVSGQGALRALASFRRAEELARRALEREPGPEALRGLVGALQGLNETQQELGDVAAASSSCAELSRVAARWVEVARSDAEREQARLALGQSLLGLSDLAAARADQPQAAARVEEAVRELRALSAAQRGPFLARGLIGLAEVREAGGDLPAARAALEEAIQDLRPRLAGGGPDRWAGVYLSTALERAARVRAHQGELGPARALADEAELVARALRDADPDDLQVRATRAEAVARQADVARQAGDLEQAAAALRELIVERRALVRHAPGDALQPRLLGNSLIDLARAEEARGDVAAATSAAAEAVALHAALAARDPADQAQAWNHAQALAWVGRAQMGRGELSGASTTFEEVLGLRRRLVERDPTSAQWGQGLATALIDLGEVRLRASQWEPARADLEEARRVCEALAAADPTHAAHLENLEIVLGKLVRLALQRGERVGAVALAREAVARNERRLALSATPTARRDRGVRLGQLAEALLAGRPGREELQEAERVLGQAAELFTALLAEGQPDAAEQLGMNLSLQGDLREAQGDGEGASARYREAVAALRRAAAGGDVMSRRHLSIALERLAYVHLHQGDGVGGLPPAEEALALRLELLARDPGSGLARRDAFGGWVLMANARQVSGDHRGGLAAWEAALEVGRGAPDSPRMRAELAQVERGRAKAAERVARLDLLEGVRPPRDERERLELAYAHLERGDAASALPLFRAALVDPALRQDLRGAHLYNAACAAALVAARAEGELAAAARAEALTWLGEDLAARRARLTALEAELGAPLLTEEARRALDQERAAHRRHLEHARKDPDLEGLRGLPEWKALPLD